MPSEDPMYQEAVSAIQQGNRLRARDLLTRLIKKEPNRSEFWLWMSAMVDTPKERVYCLKEVLKLEPDNRTARKGLIYLGLLPPDPSLAIPGKFQHRAWQPAVQIKTGAEAKPIIASWRQITVWAGGFVLLVAIIALTIYGTQQIRAIDTARFSALPTAGPSPTYLPKASSLASTTVPNGSPQPLWMSLKATYTPTALYVSTTHPRSEDFRIAMKNLDRGQWQEAIRSFEFVRSSEPDAPDIDYYIGEAYRNMGNSDEALKAYDNSLATDPNFAPAYLGRGRTLLTANNKLNEAKRSFDKALSLDPNLYEANLELAGISIQNKQGDEALKYLEPVAQSAPDSFMLYYYRARANLLVDKSAEALQDALKANQIDITNLSGYRLIAEVYNETGELSKALDPLITYTTYSTGDAQAYAWLGGAYAQLGQDDKALEAYSQSLKFNTYNFDAYLQRGLLYLKQEKVVEAIKDLKLAVQINRETYTGQMALGKAYMLHEDYGQAYLALSNASAFKETDAQEAEVHYWLGQSLEKHGDTGPALKEYKALLDMDAAVVPEDWAAFARDRIAQLIPPTATVPTSTATSTRWPTNTSSPTRTARPTITQTPTKTPKVNPATATPTK